MLTQTFLATTAKIALLLGAVLVAVGAVRRWMLGELPWNAEFGGWAALTAAGVVLVVTIVRRRSLPEAAEAIDRLGATHDRFVSALAFSREPESPELQVLAVQE